MKPHEFLQLAVELSRSRQPARLRTAISRAYYAVYHKAIELLADFGIRPGKGAAAHGDVRNRLSDVADAGLNKIASQMADLHSKRIDADYRLDRQVPEHADGVLNVVEEAREIILILDSYQADPRRSQIRKAVEKKPSK